MKNEKIFVTGATGFIGSHFIKVANANGYDLVCLRRPLSNNLNDVNNNIQWVEGSLEDNFLEELQKCDIFVHLAAHSVNVPYDNLENCLYWNLTAPLQILQQANEAGINKFLVIGTGYEYGKTGERFQSIPVNAPLEPTMTYSASKAAASIVFSQWAIANNNKLKYLRIFNVFGKGEKDDRLWPSLKKAAHLGEDYYLTSGEQVRIFTPVEVIATQLLEELDFSGVKSGEPFFKHIAKGEPQSIKEYVEFWWKQWGAKGKLHFGKRPYRDNEVMRFVPIVDNN
jgi:nucleoside-diphosphate-sugar epimerase